MYRHTCIYSYLALRVQCIDTSSSSEQKNYNTGWRGETWREREGEGRRERERGRGKEIERKKGDKKGGHRIEEREENKAKHERKTKLKETLLQLLTINIKDCKHKGLQIR